MIELEDYQNASKYEKIASARIKVDRLMYEDHEQIVYTMNTWLKGAMEILALKYPDPVVREVSTTAFNHFTERPRTLFSIYDADMRDHVALLGGVSLIDGKERVMQYHSAWTRNMPGSMINILADTDAHPRRSVGIGLSFFNVAAYDAVLSRLAIQDGKGSSVMRHEIIDGSQAFIFNHSNKEVTLRQYGQVLVQAEESIETYDVYATHTHISTPPSQELFRKKLVTEREAAAPIFSLNTQLQ
jgi:hypothetical protein